MGRTKGQSRSRAQKKAAKTKRKPPEKLPPLRCCNPFQKANHSSNSKTTLKVRNNLIEKAKTIGIVLDGMMYLCVRCKVEMCAEAKKSSTGEAERMELIPSQREQSASEITSISSSSTVAISSGSQRDESVHCDRNTLLHKVNDVLSYIGRPVLNNRDIRSAKYLKENLESMSTKIEEILSDAKGNTATTKATLVLTIISLSN